MKKKLRLRSKMKKWWVKNINKIECDFVLMRELDRYYLCLPMTKEQKVCVPKYNTVSLDPGVRTFQTFYSPDGIYGKIGDGKINDIEKLHNRIDEINQTKSITIEKRKRRNLNKRCRKLRIKIRNIVKDLHFKTATYLCENYKNILLPSFNVKQMINKNNRKISKRTVRNMISLSHYKFKEILKYKASCYKDRNVFICDESYTSKTCGKCGYLKDNLGGSKIYECNNCKSVMDRDVNGARNVLLRILSVL